MSDNLTLRTSTPRKEIQTYPLGLYHQIVKNG